MQDDKLKKMLSDNELAKLKENLIAIESKKIVSEITWQTLKPQILALSDADGEAITLAITGRGGSAIPLIQEKLQAFISAEATQSVESYLNSLTPVQIKFLARLLW